VAICDIKPRFYYFFGGYEMKSHKYLAIILVFVMIFTINIASYKKVYAEPTTVTLTNSITLAIAWLLTAAGAKFTDVQSLKNAAVHYWDNQIETTKVNLYNSVVNAVIAGRTYMTIDDLLWQDTKTWNATKYVDGMNNVQVNLDGEYQKWQNYGVSPYKTAIYPYQAIVKDGASILLFMSQNKLYIYDSGTYFNIKTDSGTLTKIIVLGGAGTIYDNLVSQQIQLPILEANYDVYTNRFITDVFFHKTTTDNVLSYNTDVSSAGNVADYDWVNSQNNTRSVPLPTGSISADLTMPQETLDTYIQSNILDKAYTDIPNADLGIQALETELGLLGSISALVTTIKDKILDMLNKVGDILSALTGGITTKLGDILAALTGAITTGISSMVDSLTKIASSSEGVEKNLNNYNIPDMLNLLILIFLAILAFILAFTTMVIQLQGIPASSSLIPSSIKTVIDFIHTAHIPGFNMSFMSILTMFGGIMIAIRILRVIRQDILHSATYASSDRGQRAAERNKKDADFFSTNWD
jgi:hypothetical protein